jgi:hypothetical protein
MNTSHPRQDFRIHPQDCRDSTPLVLVRTAGGALHVIDAADAQDLLAELETSTIRRGVGGGVVLLLEHADLGDCAPC